MSADSWTLRLICTQAEAETAELGATPLSANELDDGRWALTAYFDAPPTAEMGRAFAALVAGAVPPLADRLPDKDWVRYTQSALVPVRAGRFLVYNEAHSAALRPGMIGLHIEAGRAFGTGHHATTIGCLDAIDRRARQRRPVRRALDLGTGTGVLALGIGKRWRRAQVIASDIDPVATETARENLASNGAHAGRRAGMIEVLTADGLGARRLGGRRDLVVANILARPLVAMAPALRRAVAAGGRLVLAGLLQHQARRVANAYLARGFTLARWDRRVAWPVLELNRKTQGA